MDSNFKILEGTEDCLVQFPEVHNFLDLVDIGSRKKAERFMKPVFAKTKLELNLLTKEHTLALYDVYTQWEDDDHLLVICIEKQGSMEQIHTLIQKLEKQLGSETLSLLEKQEQLELILKRMEEIVLDHDNLYNFGKVASVIAAELRKPLVRIKGFVDLLKPVVEDSGREHYANIIIDEVKQANNLIYQYLSITKPELPQKTQVNIQKLLIDTIASLKNESVNRNCEIKYVREQILPVLMIDMKQITQVLVNIMINAMEAIQAGPNRSKGLITVKTIIIEEKLEILIQDNGAGMDQETLMRIFTPFFTTKEKGTGIGLAVCLKIIQNHGGILEANSQLGEGTSMKIILPIEPS